MSRVEVTGVAKRYGAVAALDGVSLTFEDGEFFGLLGPSGSGKTTLLRMIAGFIEPDEGTIAFDGERVEQVPVHKRGIGMVFQSYALFPHMTVAQNIAFGLDVRATPRADVAHRVEELLDFVQLEGLGNRKPAALSGGQQQRVALARALAPRPKVLLLDEPLGALDRKLRQEMQVELKEIQRSIGITTIFVTHDQEEALTLSDRIAIIDRGKLVQVGEPRAVYERPRNLFAARFLGDANVLEGAASGEGVRLADGTLIAVAGGKATLAVVRPEKVDVGAATARGVDGGSNRLTGEVRQAIFSGASLTYHIRVPALGSSPFIAFVQNRTASAYGVGDTVSLSWPVADTVAVAP